MTRLSIQFNVVKHVQSCSTTHSNLNIVLLIIRTSENVRLNNCWADIAMQSGTLSCMKIFLLGSLDAGEKELHKFVTYHETVAR